MVARSSVVRVGPSWWAWSSLLSVESSVLVARLASAGRRKGKLGDYLNGSFS